MRSAFGLMIVFALMSSCGFAWGQDGAELTIKKIGNKDATTGSTFKLARDANFTLEVEIKSLSVNGLRPGGINGFSVTSYTHTNGHNMPALPNNQTWTFPAMSPAFGVLLPGTHTIGASASTVVNNLGDTATVKDDSITVEVVDYDADINGNGEIDFADFLILSGNFGETVSGGLSDGDLDGNGEVDFTDFLMFSRVF